MIQESSIKTIESHRWQTPLFRVGLVVLSMALSVVVCYQVAERYYFDLFFYQRSAAHGYFSPGRKYEAFGKRAAEMIQLHQFIQDKKEGRQPTVLGTSTPHRFTIAVIGDSYVWGQGLRENDRFTHVLEKMLGGESKVKILSYGMAGDNIFDNYLKYQIILEQHPDVDLFIFGIVDNDLLFNNADRYDPDAYAQIEHGCDQIRAIYDFPYNDKNPVDAQAYDLHQRVDETFTNPNTKNYCMFQTVLSKLPTQRAVYIAFDSFFWQTSALSEYVNELKKTGNNVLADQPDSGEELRVNYTVSKREEHPSAAANRFFAQILYDYIMTHHLIDQAEK